MLKNASSHLSHHQYVSVLVRIHNRCGFDDEEEDSCLQCGHSCGHTNRLRERRVRDRLIFGLRDSSMQRRVLLEDFGKNLTLDRVLQVCKAHESSTDTGHALSSQDPSAHLLAARQSSYKRQAHVSRPQRTTTETSPCYYCGDGSHPRSQCPARRQFCQQCGKQGHFAVVCRQKAPQSVQQATLGHLYLHQTEKAGNHLISILVTLHNDCQREIRWLPDSGADVDAFSAQDFNRLGLDLQNHLAPDRQLVRTAVNSVHWGLSPQHSPSTVALATRHSTSTHS